jgi:hypothetical protein
MLQNTKFSIGITLALAAAICVISSLMIICIPLASAQMQLPISASTTSTSMVSGVSVTAINATDDNKIIANLNYSGNSTATPAVTLVGAAINNKDLSSMMSKLMKGPGGSAGTTTGNASSTQGVSKSATQFPSILTGSNVLKAGWKSPAIVTVKLQGNTTTPLHKGNLISLQVIPYTG